MIPMYVMTIGSVAIIIILALILSVADLLRYTPLEIISSTIAFTVSGVVFNKILSKLYSVNPNQTSAIITSLLLVAVFGPSTNIATLLQYIIVSAFAQASKYIITYRSRHIFNPAALAIFIAGTAQLQYANWWIGTPSLLPITIILSYCILKKTNHLYIGAWFVAISTILISYTDIQNGATIQQAMMTSLASWPIIFIAGFMLSEPLTLPGTHKHKIITASIVAIITSLPINLVFFNTTPAFALLIGNIIAFGFAYHQRHSIYLKLKDSTKIANNTYEYTFTSSKKLTFRAGQFIEIQLPHTHPDIRGMRRYFSIASAPQDSEIKLGIKFYQPSSSFKQALRHLKPNTKLRVVNTGGDFVLPNNSQTKLLFIAGGIGVTPFISQIRDTNNTNQDIAMAYFNKAKNDIAYFNELTKSKHDIKFIVEEPSEATSLIHGTFDTDQIIKLFPDYKEREIYISGPPSMVSSIEKSMSKITKKPIHTDYFTGY